MTTKNKPKNKLRTSKSKANKKVAVPRWAIVVVALIIAGVGIFLVYNSFASTTVEYTKAILYCVQGKCRANPFTYNGLPSSPNKVYLRAANETIDVFGRRTYRCETRFAYRETSQVEFNGIDYPVGHKVTLVFTGDIGGGGPNSSKKLRKDVCLAR